MKKKKKVSPRPQAQRTLLIFSSLYTIPFRKFAARIEGPSSSVPHNVLTVGLSFKLLDRLPHSKPLFTPQSQSP